MRRSGLRGSVLFTALTLAACSPKGDAVAQRSDPLVETVASGLRFPWSIAFLPGGDMLVTEKKDGVRRVSAKGEVGPLLTGVPSNVLTESDSGYLDLALDPDFADNQTVYLSFVEGNSDANRTAVWKARLEGNALTGGRVIYRAPLAKAGPKHPGARMIFLPDKTMLLTIGDGANYRDKAQDMASPLGKIMRIDREGKAPADNPYTGKAGHLPEIWSAGHRNPQGLVLDPASGTVWEHEHGPMGGDEVNRIERGGNYGWPLLTHGVNYDGSKITDRRNAAGFVDARHVWVPSIGPSGVALAGKGDVMLVGALAARLLVRLTLDPKSGQWTEQARLLTGTGARIRDVRTAPDGRVYLLSDDNDGVLWRLKTEAVTP